MRVHFFVRTLNDQTGGGSHYNSIAYIRALQKHGHVVVTHVLYPRNNAFPADITPIVHDCFGRGHFGERAYIAALLREYENDADVFFLYSVEFFYGGGVYRRSGGRVPVVVYIDSCIPSLFTTDFEALSWSMWLYQLKRWPWDKTFGLRDARYIDRFLPCSPYIGETYMRFGFPRRAFSVLPNIVPNAARPASYDVQKKELTILYVGRFALIKGVDLLIEAVARLKHFGVRLILVGDGEMRAQIESLIKKYDLDVEMPGWVPEGHLGPYYAQADIFAHPTRCLDAAPRSVVEALQWGLPVVVPNTGGAAWIGGDAGLVYDVRNKGGLSRALEKILTLPELRQKLATHATAQVARFEENEVYPQLERTLREVMEKKYAA